MLNLKFRVQGLDCGATKQREGVTGTLTTTSRVTCPDSRVTRLFKLAKFKVTTIQILTVNSGQRCDHNIDFDLFPRKIF